MKSSFWLKFILSMACSPAMISAGTQPNSPPGSPNSPAGSPQRSPRPASIDIGGQDQGSYDSPLVNMQVLKCDNLVFNRRDTYAAVHQALSLMREKKHAVFGCKNLKTCAQFPSSFKDNSIKFKHEGPYYSFPIRASGEIYKGGLPGRDRVIFIKGGIVVAVLHARFGGWQKCLFDDFYSPVQRSIAGSIKANYLYWRGGKATNN